MDPWMERAIHAIASSTYASTLWSMMDLGLQLFMCLYGLSVFLETPHELRKGRIPYVVVSFAILTLSGLAAVRSGFMTFKFLYDSAGPGDIFRLINELESAWHRIAAVVLIDAYIWLGDGLLLYRCYMIWKDRAWAITLPALLYISSIVVEIYQIQRQAKVLSNPDATIADYDQIIALNSSFLFLTVSTNIIVTALIAFKLLRAHSRFSSALPGRDVTIYRKIAGIVIESAVPLTACGIGYAITDIFQLSSNPYLDKDNSSSINKWATMSRANIVLGMLYYSAAALAPQMLIFRVTTGRSWISHALKASGTGPAQFSQALQFNHTMSNGSLGAHDAESAPGCPVNVAKGPSVSIA
ncbi:hypothetical protein CC1G_05779 [Coprinopsis cinerea okayama7|uniref:Pheromone receptor n=1 Tax=Coprinopsis cinerea (strain Okayama-7 / 130 / ATCC MYA-4618 / FGSC 9003) TaxID=240176 RepID=A8NLB1_COPC7|nr:hypothetical protein CC1G_05779 [Coprinopsis cinerea okayama7\|eukprot:XP_001834642.2 hypothetical protein CC1G_05779 [Coprinopsis cinerea okayama7\